MMLRMYLRRKVKFCGLQIDIISKIIKIEGLIPYRIDELLRDKYIFEVRRAIALEELKILAR